MKSIKDICDKIIQDPMNIEYTSRGYKPIFMASNKARILIIGQAPGKKTQEASIVFKDKSGDTLREWLGVNEDTFYNSGLFSVLPLDFYFPGKGKTGDLPPRNGFAQKWHPPLLSLMPHIKLTILIGHYAQMYYLKDNAKGNLTETVSAYKEYLPDYFVLVHPSPLNFRWFAKNPDFLEITVPMLRNMIRELLKNEN